MDDHFSILRKNFPAVFEIDPKLIEAAAKAEEERRRITFKNELLKRYGLESVTENNNRERLICILQKVDKGIKISQEDNSWFLQLKNDALNNELLKKYSLDFSVKYTDKDKLLCIIQQLDRGGRLQEEDIFWLKMERKETFLPQGYFSEKVRTKYHKNEAEFYAGEFKKKKDCWMAVNASSHYRKCEEPINADLLLNSIDINKIQNVKLKSAIFTTHGGAKRDLGKLKEALRLGEQAHVLTPQDFRPCTLIGAVNMEMGNYDEGRLWYDKAVERGYTEKAVDDDLRNIFMRAEKSKQDKLREYLLNIDPFRYSWVKKVHKKHN